MQTKIISEGGIIQEIGLGIIVDLVIMTVEITNNVATTQTIVEITVQITEAKGAVLGGVIMLTEDNTTDKVVGIDINNHMSTTTIVEMIGLSRTQWNFTVIIVHPQIICSTNMMLVGLTILQRLNLYWKVLSAKYITLTPQLG